MPEAKKGFTTEQARRFAEEIGIDWSIAPFDVATLRRGSGRLRRSLARRSADAMQVVLMLPSMIVAMLYRVDEYSQPHVAKAVATPVP